MTTEHPLIVLILVAFATFPLVDAQAVSLSLLDYRAGATSVTVTGRLTATTYVPPFSVLTITISGSFPSGNFNSPADVVTSCALPGLRTLGLVVHDMIILIAIVCDLTLRQRMATVAACSAMKDGLLPRVLQ